MKVLEEILKRWREDEKNILPRRRLLDELIEELPSDETESHFLGEEGLWEMRTIADFLTTLVPVVPEIIEDDRYHWLIHTEHELKRRGASEAGLTWWVRVAYGRYLDELIRHQDTPWRHVRGLFITSSARMALKVYVLLLTRNGQKWEDVTRKVTSDLTEAVTTARLSDTADVEAAGPG